MLTRLFNTYFFTATINNWQNLLADENLKKIIIESLQYCVSKNRIELLGFVIMPNHIHLILRLGQNETQKSFQRDFLKFISQQIIKLLIREEKQEILENYRSTQADRIYQIWERRPKWIEILNVPILDQKLNYIHSNPLQSKWNLVTFPSDYAWSSAKFYFEGIDEFGILNKI